MMQRTAECTKAARRTGMQNKSMRAEGSRPKRIKSKKHEEQSAARYKNDRNGALKLRKWEALDCQAPAIAKCARTVDNRSYHK